jgi:DNA-binding MarR family transcriptional regulator
MTNGPIVRIDDSVLTKARLLSRSVTEIFDDTLRPFGISSAQFVLLSVISQTGPITRSQIARLQHLDKSTLTRNLKKMLSEGWVEEVRENADGRSRPIALTAAGKELLVNGQPAWLEAQALTKELLGKDGAMAL